MLKIKLLALICASFIHMSAQTINETGMQTKNERPHIGYFVNPSVQISEIAGSSALIPEICAGIMFNKSVYLGMLYKFIASEKTPAGEIDNRYYLDQSFYGVKGEYSLQPDKRIHFNFPVEFGVGETELDLKDAFEEVSVAPVEDAWFAYFEPGAALELNLSKYAKVDFTVGYRFVSKTVFRNLSEKNLMGFTFSAGLKIGTFWK